MIPGCHPWCWSPVTAVYIGCKKSVNSESLCVCYTVVKISHNRFPGVHTRVAVSHAIVSNQYFFYKKRWSGRAAAAAAATATAARWVARSAGGGSAGAVERPADGRDVGGAGRPTTGRRAAADVAVVPRSSTLRECAPATLCCWPGSVCAAHVLWAARAVVALRLYLDW